MKRTGKPETVSLTVNGPTRTNGQQTKPTPRAGSGAGATGRTKHMQEQKNNTKPKFTTNVYVHRTKLHVLKPRTRCLLGSGGNNRAQGICVLPIRFLVGLVIRHGLVAAVGVPISTRTDTKIGGRWRIIITRLIAWDMCRRRRDSHGRNSAHRGVPTPMKSKKGSANFTSHWTTAIVAIIKQCNPAIKEDKARRIAKKTAKELRNTIMDGQHDIWKIRNQVKHGITEDGKMARETIEMLIEERAQYKIGTPMTATDVAKWTKAKQNKWKNKTEEKIAKAQKAKERLRRLQATWVSYGFTFEQRTTREDSNYTRTTRNTATQETKQHTDDSNDKQNHKTRPQADNIRDQDTTNSNKRKVQPNDRSSGKKTKYGNVDTMQHEKLKRHTRKRKRTPTEERSLSNSEEDQNNTSGKNNKEEESAEGKRKYKSKKPNNYKARYQQISDSSDASNMSDDSDNDSMNDQTREEPAENRKGVG